MSDLQLNLRRAIVRLAVGNSADFNIPATAVVDAQTYVERFARGRLIGIRADITDTGLTLTRTADLASAARYGEMDGLAIGAAHMFHVSLPEQASVRRMATYRNQDGSGRFFSCSARADGILVTRLPMTPEERQTAGAIELPARKSKYDLARLADVNQIRFEISRADQSKLRLAVHQFAARYGWAMRCRLQDDGSMLVYRTDKAEASPAPDADSAAITSP